MATQTTKNKNERTANLIRLHDYFKYMYEDEKGRSERLNGGTNTYLVVITFAVSFLGGLLGYLSPRSLDPAIAFRDPLHLALLIALAIAIILILLSLVLTVLAIKIRSFERLCNPADFAGDASSAKDEDELLSSIIANYVVATERNFQTNNVKARYLARGLRAYLVGMVLFLLAILGVYLKGR